tara:strand:- start:204 stop:1517 length:1314 start_codon:yes stop_codon:yes gene_type:complete
MISVNLLQQKSIGKALSIINGALIFGFFSTLVLIPEAYWWFGMASIGSTLLALVVLCTYRVFPLQLTIGDFKLVFVLLFFGSVWWLSVLNDGSLPFLARDGFHHLYLWPFIAASFLIALRIFTPSPHWFWLGVCCGSLGAGAVALYERVVLGLSRADNGINAIPFGNLSLLMGFISLIACIYYLQKWRTSYSGLAILAICAAFLGCLASLLSGTRGGWVAIPFLVALLLPATSNLISSKVRIFALIFVFLFVIAIIAYPPSGVWVRLVAIFDDLYQYFINNEADTSLGTRFELWRAGWIMFVDNPGMGIGEGSVQERLSSLVTREIAYDRGIIVPQLHSDVIDTLARRGLLGASSLILMYVAFASAFASKMLHGNNQLNVRLMAVSGMMVVIAFFDFGLSQAMFRDLRGLSGFLGFVVIIWSCLGHQSNNSSILKTI